MDVETTASQSGVFISQNMCHIMILFYNCSFIKEERYKNVMFLSTVVLDKIGFLMKRKHVTSKIQFFVMQPLLNPPLCSRTQKLTTI